MGWFSWCSPHANSLAVSAFASIRRNYRRKTQRDPTHRGGVWVLGTRSRPAKRLKLRSDLNAELFRTLRHGCPRGGHTSLLVQQILVTLVQRLLVLNGERLGWCSCISAL